MANLWQQEFPDFPADGIPAWVLATGTDESYRHDTCPCFGIGRRASGALVHLWVNYPNQADRENPAAPRFQVTSLGSVLWSGEDEEGARRAISQALA